jgi:hypothetical protein
MECRVYPSLNPGVSDCPASSQSDTGMNKNVDAGTSRYRNKGTQSGTGMLRYRTEIHDAGMPMPAASTSMPMPSYAVYIYLKRPPLKEFFKLNLITKILKGCI